MNVVTYLIEELDSQGVTKLFLTLGSHIDPLVSALLNNKKVTPVICAHEAGAGFMAQGYCLSNDCVGVAACIGGPGFANMVPALLTAKHDNKPFLLITGDVPSTHQQLSAFQNAGENHMADIALAQVLCKSTTRVEKADDFPRVLASSLILAKTRPFGPVHIQIPRDIFEQSMSTSSQVLQPQIPSQLKEAPAEFEELTYLLAHANKPLVYLGGRANQWLKENQLHSWLEQMQMPIITTIYARGLIAEDSPLFIGSAGFAGSAEGNVALLHEQCDLLIVIGADLSERNFLKWHAAIFATTRKIVLIDEKCDQTILNTYQNVKWLPFTEQMPPFKNQSSAVIVKRKKWLNALKTSFVSQHYLTKIQQLVGQTTKLFVDAGTAKSLASRYWQAHQVNAVLMSANTGSMGWAMCAAIGAALGKNAEPVIAIIGDGTTRMLGVELSTAAQYNAPVLFLINNNKQQQSVYDRMTPASKQRLDEAHPNINWTTFARSLNIAASSVCSTDEIMKVLDAIWPISKPYLLDITIPEEE